MSDDQRPEAAPAVTTVTIRGGDERTIRDTAQIIMALLDTRGVEDRAALSSRPRIDVEVVATPARVIAERMRAGAARIDESAAEATPVEAAASAAAVALARARDDAARVGLALADTLARIRDDAARTGATLAEVLATLGRPR